MIKIDKTELIRNFVVLEGVFVGIPLFVFWSSFGVLYLISGLFNFYILYIIFRIFLFIFSFYFFLPSLIAPGMFQGDIIPKGFGGWLAIVVTYSVIALLIALTLSFYTPLRNIKNKLRKVKITDQGEKLNEETVKNQRTNN